LQQYFFNSGRKRHFQLASQVIAVIGSNYLEIFSKYNTMLFFFNTTAYGASKLWVQ
jgi:hypothetical protein